jgi:hypothetical protein
MINETNGMTLDQLLELYSRGERINLNPTVFGTLGASNIATLTPQLYIQTAQKNKAQPETRRITSLSEMMEYLNGNYKINDIKYLGNGDAVVTLSGPSTGAFIVIIVFALIIFLVYAFFYYKAGKWVAKKIDERT